MSRTDVFFDSNVLPYVLSAGSDKALRSEQLLAAGGVISVQVLNECAHAMRRKFKAQWPLVHQMLASARNNCSVVPVTEEIHVRGLAFAERYQFQVYDGMIVAAALIAGCTTLWSEDMNDGMVIDGLTIRNPYRS